MDTELLQNFMMLAKYENYSIAAEECFISQSALSKRIKKLETQVGIELFDRTTKSVALNEYGKLFAVYAQKMLTVESDCMQALQKMMPEKRVSLVIGAIPSLSKYHLTDLISRFIAETKIPVQLITAPSEKLEELLRAQECDAAFIRQVQDPENIFLKRQITTDHLMVVVPHNHPLAKEKVLEISALKQEDFVLLPNGTRPYNTCIYLCKKNGFTPHVVFTDSKISNIIDFITNGLGISLLMNKNITDEYKKRVKVVPLTPVVQQSVDLCMLNNKRRTAEQKKLLAFFSGLNVDSKKLENH